MRRVQMMGDIKWGLVRGMVAAVGFSAIVVAQYLLFGSGVVKHYGLTLPTVLVTYLAMGIVGGLIAGVGRPLARTHLGAMVMGVIIAAVGYGFFAVAMYGLPSHWDGGTCVVIAIISVVGGVYGGDKYYNKIS
jgi:hypothetical protein